MGSGHGARRSALPRLVDASALRARARRRGAAIALCLAVVGGFFAIAFVQAQLVAGQQDLDQLRAQIGEAEQRRAQLSQAVDEAGSPASIVFKAEQLGMVRATKPVYLAATAPPPALPSPVFIAPEGGVDQDLMALGTVDASGGEPAPVGVEPAPAGAQPDPATTPSTSPLAGSTAVSVGTESG